MVHWPVSSPAGTCRSETSLHDAVPSHIIQRVLLPRRTSPPSRSRRPARASQSPFDRTRAAAATVSSGPTMSELVAFRNRIGCLGRSSPGLGRMVRIVQPDRQQYFPIFPTQGPMRGLPEIDLRQRLQHRVARKFRPSDRHRPADRACDVSPRVRTRSRRLPIVVHQARRLSCRHLATAHSSFMVNGFLTL